MVNMDRGPRRDPIDPKAVKIGAEQEDFRAIKPWDEFLFLISRPWAVVRWPFRMLRRVFSRGSSEGDDE